MSVQYNQLIESNENFNQNSNFMNNINNKNMYNKNQNINMSGENNNNNSLIEDNFSQNKNNQNQNMVSSGFNPYLRPPQTLKWRKIMKIDLDIIRNTRDLSLLNTNLENIIYSEITEEDIQSVPEENVIKLIKILQFLNEFLLEQEQIINNNLISLEQEGKKLEKKKKELYNSVIKQDEYIKKLKKDADERLKQITNYKNAIDVLMKDGKNNLRGKNIKITDISMNINKNTNTYGYNQYNNNNLKAGYKCKYCIGKVFPSEFELKKHLTDIHLISQYNDGQQILKGSHNKSQITLPIEVNLQPMNLMNNNTNGQLEKKLTDMRFEFQNQMHQFEMNKLRNQLMNQKNINDNGENCKQKMEKMGNAFNDTLKQVLGVLVNNQQEQPKIIKRKKKEKNTKLDEEINFIKSQIAKANLESQEYDMKITNKKKEINILINKKQELMNTIAKGQFIPKKKKLVPTQSEQLSFRKFNISNKNKVLRPHSGQLLSDHDDSENKKEKEEKIKNQIAEETKLMSIIANKGPSKEEKINLSLNNLFKNLNYNRNIIEGENIDDDFYNRYIARDNKFLQKPRIDNYKRVVPIAFNRREDIQSEAKSEMKKKIKAAANFACNNFKDYNKKMYDIIEVEELKNIDKEILEDSIERLLKNMDILYDIGEEGHKHLISMKEFLNFENIGKNVK